MAQNELSEHVQATRIVSHGKITASGVFILNNKPFSIYLKPKSETDDACVVMSARLYNDTQASDAPFNINDWTPMEVVELTVSAETLSSYDIYWGSGYIND